MKHLFVLCALFTAAPLAQAADIYECRCNNQTSIGVAVYYRAKSRAEAEAMHQSRYCSSAEYHGTQAVCEWAGEAGNLPDQE